MRLVFKRCKIFDDASAWCADDPRDEGHSFYWLLDGRIKEMLRGYLTK